MLPDSPRAAISRARCSTPTKLQPVDGPTRRPSRADKSSAAAKLIASGTRNIRSITVGTKLGSTRGRPMPSMRLRSVERRSLRRCTKASKNTDAGGSTTASRVVASASRR